MMLHNAVRDAKPGDIIRVLATDPSTERDIPKFCQFLGHELLSTSTENECWTYFIRTVKDQD